MFRVSLGTQTFSTVSARIWNALIVKFNVNVPLTRFNPIRSGGGSLKAPPPPPIFCSHAFNVGAALLCLGDFSQKIV